MIQHQWGSLPTSWARKSLLSLLIVTLVLSVWGGQPSRAAESAIKVRFDEKELQLGTKPYLRNGTTLVPMRPLFEALGIDLAWDAASKRCAAPAQVLMCP